MGKETKIPYCDSTVNPIMGCTGCELLEKHCYAHRLCRRYASLKGWPAKFTEPEYFPGRLEKALKWKDLTGTARPDKPWLDGMPRVIFVNDLSDGFCPGGVDPTEWLAPVLGRMFNSRHVWLLLTKWPDRMREWLDGLSLPDNIWLGTTLLRQDDAWRLDELLRIQGGKKWVSCEPLLGAMNLENYLGIWTDGVIDARHQGFVVEKPLTPNLFTALSRPMGATLYERQLDFVTTGGETGVNPRPTHPDNFRSLRDQCGAAQVPYFHKSNGEWLHGSDDLVNEGYGNPYQFLRDDVMFKVGKERAGHWLDGQAWRQMPIVTPRNT